VVRTTGTRRVSSPTGRAILAAFGSVLPGDSWAARFATDMHFLGTEIWMTTEPGAARTAPPTREDRLAVFGEDDAERAGR
jgi:hypothetical protein